MFHQRNRIISGLLALGCIFYSIFVPIVVLAALPIPNKVNNNSNNGTVNIPDKTIASTQPRVTTKTDTQTIQPPSIPPVANERKITSPTSTVAENQTYTNYTTDQITTNTVNNANQTTAAKPATVWKRSLSDKEYQMLVRIISAEAKGESLTGQVAVGAVILNRLDSNKFPNTITANVMKSGEFEPVANGQIWSKPQASAYRAADLALQGWDPTYGALYFYNPAKVSASSWVWSRRTLIRIGDHNFAA